MDLKRIVGSMSGYPLALLSVLLTAAVLLPFRGMLTSLTVMLLFVPVIIVVARATGVRGSAAAALLAFIAIDLLFVPPYYRFTVASPAEWIGLVVFLIVALVSGQQTARLRERERAAVHRGDELALLNRLSFRIASEKSVSAVAEFVVAQVAEVLGAARSAIYTPGEGRLAQSGLVRASVGELELVDWVLRSSKAVGLTAESMPLDQRMVSVGPADAVRGITASATYIPLQTAGGLEGVLLAEPAEGRPFAAEEARLLAAVANLAAASLERERLEADAAHAEALREADRLKSTLVSSVSHELKTPLAAATARVTGLLEEGVGAPPERIRDELEAVAGDLARLDVSIGDLLDLSRLESDAWQPRLDVYDVDEILGTVISRLSAAQRERTDVALAADLPPVRADFAQLARAIAHLLENAFAYGQGDTRVELGARSEGETVAIWVEDAGPGVSDDEKGRIFEKFYRGRVSVASPGGTGLGLAIAREIVRAHGGTLRVEDVDPHGARFVLRIPSAEEVGS